MSGPLLVLPGKLMGMQKYTLSLLKIPVTDVERSAKFYAEGLGWPLQFAAKEFGWAHFQVGDLGIALYVPGMGGGNRAPGGSLDFHLTVPDLKALKEKLNTFDAGLAAELFEGDDGSCTLEFSDPDGNEWRLTSLGPMAPR